MSYYGKRITQGGQPLNYTCTNNNFQTNINLGFHHGTNNTRGSVLNTPLHIDNECSLWIEHVTDHSNPRKRLYWLMWYNANGTPTINTSAIFDKNEVKALINNLVSSFLNIP